MYKKAIVMEIKAAYAIAMEEGGSIIRIKKKDGLSVGDSIYVLPEDLYQGQEACSDSSLHRFPRKLVPFPGIKKSSLVKIASIAAMLILCITLVLPQLTVTTYAQASFDGAGSIQLSLDRNLQIIKAVSPDQSVSDSVLKALHGKHINEAGETLRSACGFDDVLVGYALTSEQEDASSLDQELRALFPSHSVTFINGTSQDIENAEKESLSLGKYLTGQQDKDHSDEPDNSDSEQDEDETEQETDTPEQDEDKTEQNSDTPEQDEDKTEQETDTPEQDEDKMEQDSDTPEQDEDKAEQDSDTLKQDETERDSDTLEQNAAERDSDASDSMDVPASEDRADSSLEDSNSDSETEQPELSEREEHSSSRDKEPRSDEDSDSEENSDSEEEEE